MDPYFPGSEFQFDGIDFELNFSDRFAVFFNPNIPRDHFLKAVSTVYDLHENMMAACLVWGYWYSLESYLDKESNPPDDMAFFNGLSKNSHWRDYLADFADEYSQAEIERLIDLAIRQEIIPLPKDKTKSELLALLDEHNQNATRLAALCKTYAMAKAFPNEHAGYVYLMHLDPTNQYKIGYSIKPDRRVREVVSGLPLEIVLLHQIASNQIACLESELHKRFADKRHSKRNEWFSLMPEDVEYIKSLTEVNYEWVGNPEWDGRFEPAPLRIRNYYPIPRR